MIGQWQEVGDIHMREVSGDNQSVVADQCFASCAYPLFAIGSEGKLRGSGVTAVEGPFGLAVADYEYSWVWHCFWICRCSE